jgi:pilus retraction protein PilT
MAYLDQFLSVIVKHGGSDLHIGEGQPPKMRMHGDIMPIRAEPIAHQEVVEMMSEICGPRNWETFEQRGDLDFAYEMDEASRFRSNYFKQSNGYGATFRLIPTKIATLEDLGIPLVIKEFANLRGGLVLVTGPTGSGKTTTLYTTLKALATSEVNVCTVEDPIEMVEGSFNQMQVQHGIDLSFADGVRALMRQDPDIIMVGEIRDLETAEMAIQAALTGHLVLSTLHTNDSPSAVMRLLELGVPYYLLETTLIGIMAQRLVRTLCADCKKPDGEVNDEVWNGLTEGWNIPKPAQVYRPVGCPECRQTGYRGRTGLYELLTITQPFSRLIKEETDIHALKQQSIADGMKPLRVAGALKITEGVTTQEEVLKVTSSLT